MGPIAQVSKFFLLAGIALTLTTAGGGSTAQTRATLHTATGTVIAVDHDQQKLTLDAAPVEDLNLPALALSFFVYDRNTLGKIRVGQKLKVEFTEQGRNFAVSRIAPLPAPAK
ncbi:MAG TPA: copper-binding protein [Burkholderiales bacterium]|nr:copper-binding protein [Burkholderiales bacterium]